MDRRVRVPGADILLEIIHASSMSMQRESIGVIGRLAGGHVD
jgi:hypothetical protein